MMCCPDGRLGVLRALSAAWLAGFGRRRPVDLNCLLSSAVIGREDGGFCGSRGVVDLPLPVLEHRVGRALLSSSRLVLLPFYSSEKFLMISVLFVEKN
jgi:hypothetical protein